jgi:hypothetical protein
VGPPVAADTFRGRAVGFLYNTAEPMLAGVPFFYWYQLLWVLLSAVIIAFVYLLER